MKLGLFVLAILALVWWWSHIKRRHDAKGPPPEARAASESIVSCLHCGLHVPDSEAVITLRGASFCSESHRQLHPDT